MLDDEGWSLLDCAGYEGHMDLLWLLLERGGKPAAHICYLRPLILQAIESRNVKTLRALCVRTGIGGYQHVPPVKTPAMLVSVAQGAIECTEVLMEAELAPPLASDDAAAQLFRVKAQLLAAAAHADVKRCKATLRAGGDHPSLAQCVTKHKSESVLHLVSMAPSGTDKAQCVRTLIQAGANVNAVDKRGATPLHAAASKCEVALLKALLDSGAQTAVFDEDNESPLFKACAAGSVTAVKLLLSFVADVRADVSLPLHWVARNGSLALLRVLLEHDGWDLHAVNSSGETPLDAACANDALPNAQALLFAGASSKKHPASLYKLLESAIDRGAVEEVRVLLKAGIDVNRKRMGASGRNALQAAIEKGHEAIVALLAAAGCSFDRKVAKNGRTCFMMAVERSLFGIAKLALRCGVALDSEAMHSWLVASLQGGDGAVAIALCRDLGLDPNAPPFVSHVDREEGASALHMASAAGLLAVVQALVACGADCNAVVGGNTALVEAVIAKQTNVCRFLVQTAGADVFARSVKSGFACIHWAADVGSHDILQLLLDAHPALLELTTAPQNETALMIAAKRNRDKAVELLLERGADTGARNKQGKLASQLATQRAVRRAIEEHESRAALLQQQSDTEPSDAAESGQLDDAEGSEDSEGGRGSMSASAYHVTSQAVESKAQRKKRRRAESLLRLTEAGFSLARAIAALDGAGGNVDAALGHLRLEDQRVQEEAYARELEELAADDDDATNALRQLEEEQARALQRETEARLAHVTGVPEGSRLFASWWEPSAAVAPLPSAALPAALAAGGAPAPAPAPLPLDANWTDMSLLGSSLFPGGLFADPVVEAQSEHALRAWFDQHGLREAADPVILSDGVQSLEELLSWDVVRMRACSLPAALRRRVWHAMTASARGK